MDDYIQNILNELNQYKEEDPLEAFTEDEQVLRLICYLQEVRDRLENNLREQRAFVQEAVSLIKELNYVSGKFAHHNPAKQASWIQRLIMGFETLSTSQNPSVSQDKALLKEFAQLRESIILKESQQMCMQARDQLTKVVELQDKATQTNVDKCKQARDQFTRVLELQDKTTQTNGSVCIIKPRFASKYQ